MVNDFKVVFVHHDMDKRLWVALGEEVPRLLDSDFREFFNSTDLTPYSMVKFLGTDSNAEMLSWLFKTQSHRFDLQVLAPCFCSKQDLKSGRVVLLCLRGCYWPASIGGFRQVTALDVKHADMLGMTDEELAVSVSDHPLYAILSFIPNLDKAALAKILRDVKDPRWFVDPLKPTRLSRIGEYMGLNYGTALRIHNGLVTKRVQRYQLLQACWDKDLQGLLPDLSDPANFLYRRGAAVTILDKPTRFKENKVFLGFLIRNWYEVIYAETQFAGEMFLPSMFFKPWEEKAFKEHLQNIGWYSR